MSTHPILIEVDPLDRYLCPRTETVLHHPRLHHRYKASLEEVLRTFPPLSHPRLDRRTPDGTPGVNKVRVESSNAHTTGVALPS